MLLWNKYYSHEIRKRIKLTEIQNNWNKSAKEKAISKKIEKAKMDRTEKITDSIPEKITIPAIKKNWEICGWIDTEC